MYQNVMVEAWYGFWMETTQFGGQTAVIPCKKRLNIYLDTASLPLSIAINWPNLCSKSIRYA
jgi:hypothetical protein